MAEPLARHTTLRLGGPARSWVRAETEAELVDAVRSADEAGDPVLLVAGGSNLVVADEGFDGTVVEIATTGVHADVEEAAGPMCGGAMVTVAAGEDWDAFVARAVERGWVGVEALVGHPGLGRGDADPERRRLRPGGQPDRRPGAGLGPRAEGRAHLRRRRLLVRLSHQPVQGRPRSPRRPRRHLPAAARHARRAGDVRRAGAHARRRRPARGPRWPTCGPRSSGSGGARAWCSTRPTTTPGAPGRSSPTRCCPPTGRCPRGRRAGSSPTGP